VRAADAAAGARPRFVIEPTSVGTFGNPRSTRVIWAGVQDTPPGALAALHGEAERALRAEQIGFEAAEFRPHITLARAQRNATPEQSAQAHRAAGAVDGWGADLEPLEVAEITVLRSELRATGPIYTPLHRSKLMK
jgi:2'-5' RNA ligase